MKAAELREDAMALASIVNENYAYLDRLPNGRLVLPDKLRGEAEAIESVSELVRFSERALALLADHHAIMDLSLADSWSLFPSYGDLWIEQQGSSYVIEHVRAGSPAYRSGIESGDCLVAISGTQTRDAIAHFWADLGAAGGRERNGYAVRVLAAGKRDRDRVLTFHKPDELAPRTVTLPSLYQTSMQDDRLVSAISTGRQLVIRLHDSLGDAGTIAAFDRIMASARPGQAITIDLTATPSGGNTSVVRAILGWFILRPTAYQVHALPVEERQTGVPRQWIEQALPRPGRQHSGPVTVEVGRWTGSVGEALAIGFDAIGAQVQGSRMAGLLGAIHEFPLPYSGVLARLPTECLYAVDGTPREGFVP